MPGETKDLFLSHFSSSLYYLNLPHTYRLYNVVDSIELLKPKVFRQERHVIKTCT